MYRIVSKIRKKTSLYLSCVRVVYDIAILSEWNSTSSIKCGLKKRESVKVAMCVGRTADVCKNEMIRGREEESVIKMISKLEMYKMKSNESRGRFKKYYLRGNGQIKS